MRLWIVLLMLTLNATAATKDYSQKADYEGCNGIQNNDKKLYCQAIDANKAEFCNRIGNGDLQNKCLAKVNNDAKYCERISDDKKKKSCEQYIR